MNPQHPLIVKYIEHDNADDILDLEGEIELSLFNADVAWELGSKAREIALTRFPAQAVKIDIIGASQEQLFHAVVGEGTSPDNDNWVRRKRNTALKFSKSSYYIGTKLKSKNLGLTQIEYLDFNDYAIHGGAVPIRVKNVSAPVGVLTVSGLKQWEDHGLACEALEYFSHS